MEDTESQVILYFVLVKAILLVPLASEVSYGPFFG